MIRRLAATVAGTAMQNVPEHQLWALQVNICIHHVHHHPCAATSSYISMPFTLSTLGAYFFSHKDGMLENLLDALISSVKLEMLYSSDDGGNCDLKDARLLELRAVFAVQLFARFFITPYDSLWFLMLT